MGGLRRSADPDRLAGAWQWAFLLLTFALLAAGLAAAWSGGPELAAVAWLAATVVGLAVSTVTTAKALAGRQWSVDVIALLALVGSLLIGEPLAGALITVMLATGNLLEGRAAARARRDLSLLVSRAPRVARRRTPDGIEEIEVAGVRRGDRLIVGTGEVVGVDGRLLTAAVLDESALTGEPLPVEHVAGDEVRSGVVNAAAPLELLATARAEDSTYAEIVRMVEQAQAATAPFVRLADRIAVIFVPVTLALAGLAWLLSGDQVRAVAVLVVATPCPLLLAAPIAIMSGMSRCSRVGVVVKGGGALERLARGTVLLFDKTGTLTQGRPTVVEVIGAPGLPETDELLRLAACLDQVSPHPLASGLVACARRRGLRLTLPEHVRELPGHGLQGTVDGRALRLGNVDWIAGDSAPLWVRQVRRRAAMEGALTVFAEVDGCPAAAFLFEDPIRPDAARMLRNLRRAGIRRAVLVTGDRAEVAEAVGRIVGVDSVAAERDPAEKVAVVRAETAQGSTVMVGDGVNDAPALAAASVGVALASRGASASSQAADVVLTVDRLGALATAITVARRSRRIALQAVTVGMGLSLVAMVAAAVGLLPPVYGALLQEVIDVLAMAVALRAVRPGRDGTIALSPDDTALIARLAAEHPHVHQLVEQVRATADALEIGGDGVARVGHLLTVLELELLPHEREEEELLYPVVARLLGGDDPMGALSRSHVEIAHYVGRVQRLVAEIGDQPIGVDDVIELRRLLYGLYAVMRLHNAQEEAAAFSLAETVDLA